MQRVSICPTTMSAIASFIKLPKSAIEGLRKAATDSTDRNYLSTNGREVAEYRWSGDVLVTLLPYLEEKHQIDLMKSEYGELAAFLTNTTRTTHFIFTPVQRAAFLNRLDSDRPSHGRPLRSLAAHADLSTRGLLAAFLPQRQMLD